MKKIYYKKSSNKKRVILKTTGIMLCILGITTFLYTLFPIFLWQIFVSPALASQNITAPIPKNILVNSEDFKSLLASEISSTFNGTNYDNASNWFPGATMGNVRSKITSYTMSFPTLNIKNAVVSTVDDNLGEHLVNFQGTAVPPEKGNAVVFGHSTLPSLYKTDDYHTIFANALNLKIGDPILVTINGVTYTYKIFSMTIVEPTDTSVLDQNVNDSILTIITCTPPGTVWERLVIGSRLTKI